MSYNGFEFGAELPEFMFLVRVERGNGVVTHRPAESLNHARNMARGFKARPSRWYGAVKDIRILAVRLDDVQDGEG